ncbi:SNF2-related protein [Reichenbachiella agarivorans]|uniref:SNF2-related protein n=1 Tax=Reichenbachiella agarivorans TaxID=2979464 RepID=A0ABY6CQ68_9BACT|nr:SNF2-related protein [Reichenbachiella agarivorans]UXP32652.1 SNF2-related protein [Reichenbachiella agarivorans]
MKVSPNEPFQLIYTLFDHQYLGYLFESFVIQLDSEGRLTFSHQNISAKNAKEFASGLDDNDYELIKIMDSMQPDIVVKHFEKKKIKADDFFLKVFDPKTGDETKQEQIIAHVERRRSKIMPLLKGKRLFEMGNDGEPAWKEIEILKEEASVLFHFRRNEDNTHYFPTIKYQDEKVDFQYKGAYILCNDPAYIVIENKLYSFQKNVDANKLKPFLNKKFIAIPRKIEDNYYRKFVAPLVASFDVYAKGFDIKTEKYELEPTLYFSELASNGGQVATDLFGNQTNSNTLELEEAKILFELKFQYGKHKYKADHSQEVNVHVENEDDEYTFYRIKRDLSKENKYLKFLQETGMPLKSSQSTVPLGQAFSWINESKKFLEDAGIKLIQNGKNIKKYFLGKSEMTVEIKENIDWFDVHAIVKFGDFEIPFKIIRNYILKNIKEIELPNGEIAVIPDAWFEQYSELMAFSNEGSLEELQLQKHHISLVKELTDSNLAQMSLKGKLQKLNDFDKIDDFEIPEGFKGELRPYQKAGYNWMRFLRSYNLGGCLADDMGLGKTVQTLTLLQSIHGEQDAGTSLLVMPTSLIYNWEKEAEKFTPNLRILNYTGVKRNKDVTLFSQYDLVLTSYGIVRQDIDLFEKFHFNYIILDESQVIKNPESIISKCVRELHSSSKLILTGTPIENTTLDLWSQMSFVNPGLLGTKSFFKKQYQIPIEKRKDEDKTKKLYSLINPFLLRRNKSQVATDLPEKIESVRYCTMSPEQEEAYEKVKSAYRDKIMKEIESGGLGKSQFMILQGLTKLRQIANHPMLADETYEGDSGKLEDISFMLDNAINKHHKILVFSQFVKHLKIVAQYLDEQKIKYAYLDGSTKDRQQQVENFQNDESIQVFLISLKAGGLGLNLTKAEYVFLLDPWWNPAIEAQAIDRAHRIGQQNKVFTYRFITKNTVEEKIMLLQQNKKQLATDLITTEESFVKNLSKADLVGLLD